MRTSMLALALVFAAGSAHADGRRTAATHTQAWEAIRSGVSLASKKAASFSPVVKLAADSSAPLGHFLSKNQLEIRHYGLRTGVYNRDTGSYFLSGTTRRGQVVLRGKGITKDEIDETVSTWKLSIGDRTAAVSAKTIYEGQLDTTFQVAEKKGASGTLTGTRDRFMAGSVPTSERYTSNGTALEIDRQK